MKSSLVNTDWVESANFIALERHYQLFVNLLLQQFQYPTELMSFELFPSLIILKKIIINLLMTILNLTEITSIENMVIPLICSQNNFNFVLEVFQLNNPILQYLQISQQKKKMNTLDHERISQKSKGILYNLKKTLEEKKMGLNDFICMIFKYLKTKFLKKQFSEILLKSCNKIQQTDIDALFDQLDPDKNQCVFFSTIDDWLKKITENDQLQSVNQKNPLVLNNSQQQNILKQVKEKLLEQKDYSEIIRKFVNENGFISKENMLKMISSFNFTQAPKQKLFINTIYDSNNEIAVQDLLSMLGINGITMLQLQQSVQHESNQQLFLSQSTRFIKQKQQQKNKQQERQEKYNLLNSQKSIIGNNQYCYNKQMIPQILNLYFNDDSTLELSFAMEAQYFLQNNLIYIDTEHPRCTSCVQWVHLSQRFFDYRLFDEAQSLIHRNNERLGLGRYLQPKDITQGSSGNCYFLSAVIAFVEKYPFLMYKLFVLNKNPAHIYGVRLFIDGIWKTIVLDACFPCIDSNRFFGAQPHNNKVWVLFLEKAWAKVYKTYENIHGGLNQEGLQALSGAPSYLMLVSQNGFFQKLYNEYEKGYVITCTSSKQIIQLSPSDQQEIGVFAGHAYSILKIYKNLSYQRSNKFSQVTLLKLKNPWGKGVWKKDWSFKSQKWTKELRKTVGYEVNPQDGTFFIEFNDFTFYFNYINISKVHVNYMNSYVINPKSSRNYFYSNMIKIQCQGNYFFTLYQQNARKYKYMNKFMGTNYDKSYSWMFLAQIKNQNQLNNIKAIACKTQKHRNNTIQATLQKGNYILISRVCWRYWEEHQYTIASYGPSKVAFKPGRQAQSQLLTSFIRSRAQIQEKSGVIAPVQRQTNIFYLFNFSAQDGIGLISISNLNTEAYKTLIKIKPAKGLLPLQRQNSLPLKLIINAGQCVNCSFIIEPGVQSYAWTEQGSFNSLTTSN